MSIDLTQARAYLSALTGEDDPIVTFQTFSDVKPPTPPDPLARVLHGTLGQRTAELARLNERGAGVFVMVSAGDLKGRKAENVTAIRAFFIDKDKTLLRPCSLEPSFIVLTSHEKGHAYWLARCARVANFTAIQKRLIAFYGSDPGVHELCRVMRLPGFYHRKKEPVVVTFEMGSGEAYTEAEILSAHPPVLVPRVTPLSRPHVGSRSASADDDEIARDLARGRADAHSWEPSDRHNSAKAVAAYMRKIGASGGEILSVIGARLVAAGKSQDEADALVAWAVSNVAEIPGDRDRVVEIERRRREREERQRQVTR